MRSQREGGLSATTQVKELSPEIIPIAQGQGLWSPEASNAACDMVSKQLSCRGWNP